MRRLLCCLAFACASAQGAVYNIHLATDNVPDYTDMDSLVSSMTDAWATDEEKATAVWRWACRGRRQTSAPDECAGYSVIDPVIFYTSYGHTFCGWISGINDAVWKYMGYEPQYIELGGHTVSQVSFDGGTTYHLFDTAGDFYCFDSGGNVAEASEIGGDATCATLRYAPECGTNPDGWRSANPDPGGSLLSAWASRFTDGFDAQNFYDGPCDWGRRYVLNLRPSEVYTRYWEPQDDAQNGGDPATDDPDYFRPIPTDAGIPSPDPDDCWGFNNIRGNGIWTFEPDLATNAYRDIIFDESGVESYGDSHASPNLHPAQKGVVGSVTFKVQAANVVTSARVEATGKRTSSSDVLRIYVSKNNGIKWHLVWQASGNGQVSCDENVRALLGGAFEYLVRVDMMAANSKYDCGLDSLKLTTVTQVNRRCLPRLELGTNTVQLFLGEQTETVTLFPTVAGDGYKDDCVAEQDLFSDPSHESWHRALTTAVGDADCWCTFKLDAPTDITKVVWGGRFYLYLDGGHCKMLRSTDGANFSEVYSLTDRSAPFDDINFETFSPQAGTKSLWFKYSFLSPGAVDPENPAYNTTGAYSLTMMAFHEPRDARFIPIEVTYNWTEHRDTGDVERSYTELVTSSQHEWTINVAGYKDPTMNWVRVNLKGYGPDGDSVTYGYSDATDVGTGYERQKQVRQWGTNLAAGRSYTASAASNVTYGDSGGELTDGAIVPATTTGKAELALWDVGTDPEFVVDLGSLQTVAAARVSANEPWSSACLPETVEVATSPDDMTYTVQGTIDQKSMWSPPGDYIGWEHDDDPSHADWPSQGRIAYSFPLVFAAPVSNVRYVRFSCTNFAGKGLGLSELEVFNSVSSSSWPDEVTMRTMNAPSVSAGAAPASGEAPLGVDFNATGSGGTGVLSYSWEFDDGGSSLVEDPQHDYAVPGTYAASVVVTDEDGQTAQAGVVVTVAGTVDSDGDSLPDWWEYYYLGGLGESDSDDNDGDGLLNGEEHILGTDPSESDTDGDGTSDGREVDSSTDPLDPSSRPASSGGGGCGVVPAAALVLGALAAFRARMARSRHRRK